jgi:uracil-DNA glycosylase family 4
VTQKKERYTNDICLKCKAYNTTKCNTPVMKAFGNRNADLMIVDSHPQVDDDKHGAPFIGVTGDYLDEDIFPYVGISSAEVYMTYAVKCRPKIKKDRTLSTLGAAHVDHCRNFLVREIQRVKPKVIIALGNGACASLLSTYLEKSQEDAGKVRGMLKWSGKRVWSSEFNCFIYLQIDVFTLLNTDKGRGSEYHENIFLNTFKEAWKACREKYTPKMAEAHVITKASDALKFLEEVWRHPYHGVDIETGGSGYDFNLRYIIGISFSIDPLYGVYFSWDLVTANPKLYSAVKALLEDRKRLSIIHNVGFEYKVFKITQGIEIQNYYDTMIAAQLDDENFYKGLKQLTWRHTDYGGYETVLERYKADHKIKEDYSKIPFEILSVYGGFDSAAAVALYLIFSKREKERGYSTLQNKILFPVRKVMSEAEITGFKLDIERAEYLRDTCTKSLQIVQDAIYETVGYSFNIRSNDQLQKVLFKELKLKPLKKTKTGYSTDKDSIEYIKIQKKGKVIGSLLSDYGYVNTMRNSHVNQALRCVWGDGRVHTSFNMTGAVTGRTSASNPSLQNVPTERLVKSMYTGSDGCNILELDLKAAEYVYLAAASGEKAFIEAFRNGYDVHAVTASLIYNLPIDEISDDQRRAAKSINFGLVYGMSIEGLASRLGLSEEEAEDFIDLYFSKLPNIKLYLEKVERLITTRGWVCSLFGRYRRIPTGLSDVYYEVSRAKRQARNSPVQGGAADYAYLGLVRAANNLRKVNFRTKLIHTVHDCGIADSPFEENEEAAVLIKEGFEREVKVLPVKMRVDLEVSKRWGEHNDSRLETIFKYCNLWEEEKWL